MRKYQQLILLVISCVSVGVLLMYKTENNRLKDVLHVINFFGRNDAVISKQIDNATTIDLGDYLYPLGVWQSIGDHFHAYSAYWRRNELVSGGEAVVLVVGRKQAVVHFKCSFNLKDTYASHNQGKFRFQRMDKDADDNNSEFTRYKFFCRVTRDFGQPDTVKFIDLTSTVKSGHSLKLRYIKAVQDVTRKLPVQPLTVCVDLVNENMTALEKQSQELLEFFIHHFALGVNDFIIYNGDNLPQNVLPVLRRINVRLYSNPFNFPFSAQNSTVKVRDLIEMDCLLRSTNRARYSLLLAPNEFFYPNSKLDDQKSILRALKHYENNVYRFDLPVFAVCKNDKFKYLFENILYDPESKSHSVSIYRPKDNEPSLNSEHLSVVPYRISLPLSQVFTHRYINCIHAGDDGLHDWRNSLREDFRLHIKILNDEIKAFI